jgi:hypothetical protein
MGSFQRPRGGVSEIILLAPTYRGGPINSWYLAPSQLINYSRKPGKNSGFFFLSFLILIIHGIWSTLSRSRCDHT